MRRATALLFDLKTIQVKQLIRVGWFITFHNCSDDDDWQIGSYPSVISFLQAPFADIARNARMGLAALAAIPYDANVARTGWMQSVGCPSTIRPIG